MPFVTDTIPFLRAIERNNNRKWFEKNRDRYESSLRIPCREFVDAIAPKLKVDFPRVKVDYRCITRIYRDTRFSDDKSPYKSWMGFSFKAKSNSEEAMPGLWVGFDPTGVSLGCGMFGFEKPMRSHFRDRVTDVDHGETFRAILKKATKAGFEVKGRDLKKVPPGYDPEHPNVEFLMHNGLYVMREFDLPASFTTDRFSDFVLKALRPTRPFFDWMFEMARTAPKSMSRLLQE